MTSRPRLTHHGAVGEDRHVIGNIARQRVLDRAAELLVLRAATAAALSVERPQVKGAEVVARGSQIGPWMMRESHSWRHLLSTRPHTTGREIRESMPNNRRILGAGVEMISIFDRDGTAIDARQVISRERCGSYHFGYAPVQMRLVDRRFVYLQGPEIEGSDSVMRASGGALMEAALRYWQAVAATARPAAKPNASGGQLTARQRRILSLLACDLTDAAVAQTLGVSVRTVRYEMAAVSETLEVRSRFAAGVRYGELLQSVVGAASDPTEAPGR